MTKERLLLTFLLIWQSIEAKNLLEAIKSNPDFSEVKNIIEKSKILPLLLQTRSFTAFVPTNDAMAKYDGVRDDKLIYYHITNMAFKIQDVPDELTTELSGNPRVYVTRIPSGNPSISGWENYEFYINNAKVISANHRSETEDGELQYLHSVDQVISPTVARSVTGAEAQAYRYPDARKVLEKSNYYDLTDKYSLRELYSRVKELNMLDTYEMEGKNTFFMPVNRAFQLTEKMDQGFIDKQFVHGHIVPEEVLFTRTVRYVDEPYKSLAFTDNLKVYIFISNVTNTQQNKITYYVTSNTVSAGPGHMKGSAYAMIVKENIPVKNGVIHLIDRPLMMIAENIMSYFTEEDGQLKQFQQLMKDYFPEMMNKLVTDSNITLFAPSNKAFELVNKNRLKRVTANVERLKKILYLHITTKRLSTDEIVEQTSTNGIFQAETMTPGRKLYFAVNDPNAIVPRVSVEGGGVNATITTPNIAAKNGIIHIIDRILGIPSETVYEKLANDPMISKTFELSKQRNWNKHLDDRNKKFTLFVPSNLAWEFIRREMASAYTKLFMGEYPSHVKNILQRHMIVNEDLTLEELEMLTTNSTPINEKDRQVQLQMTRGKIYFQARVVQTYIGVHGNLNEDKEFSLEWNGISARIVRPDVECVNGVVHVIDRVLMTESDVTVSGSNRYTSRGVDTVVTVIMSITLAWTLI